jgi:hypothetical protein
MTTQIKIRLTDPLGLCKKDFDSQELLGLRQPRHKGVKVIAEVTLQ